MRIQTGNKYPGHSYCSRQLLYYLSIVFVSGINGRTLITVRKPKVEMDTKEIKAPGEF